MTAAILAGGCSESNPNDFNAENSAQTALSYLDYNANYTLDNSGEVRPFVPYSQMEDLWSRKILQANYLISPYDEVIRTIAEREGRDWRLISAIACAESQFDPQSVSNKGAQGLMQIMPVVARQFRVDETQITEPSVNVWLGVELLGYIENTFRFPKGMPEQDRLSIILASYNCGMGHVLDARRLALKYGENPNSWEVVARYLTLKSEPEYFDDEAVKCGQFSDSRQTIGFVKKVLRQYDAYCEITTL